MISLADITNRVRTKHEAATSVRWSDAAIHKRINEGLECLAESTYFYERYTTIALMPNRTWYDVRGFTPETVLRITAD